MSMTTIKPRGTVSILNGQSSGIQSSLAKRLRTGVRRSAMIPNYNPPIPPKFSKVTEAVVDGAVWYTVFIEPEVMMWLKTLNSTQWTYIPGGHWRLHVDVHEQLYTALVLRWS